MSKGVPKGWRLSYQMTDGGTGQGDEQFGWVLYHWEETRVWVGGHLWWKRYEPRMGWVRRYTTSGGDLGKAEAIAYANETEEMMRTRRLLPRPSLATD